MPGFRRIYIANRGEIALRIIRTCRDLGIETVLGVSVADEHSLPSQVSDESGPYRTGESCGELS